MKSPSAAPPLVADYLVHQAAKDGHDPAAAKRLLSHVDMRPVWKWLAKFSDVNSQLFVVSALMARVDFKAWAEQARREGGTSVIAYAAKSPSETLRAVFATRQRGVQSDYLRAFVAHLHEFRFPLNARGVQAAIAKTANVVLEDALTKDDPDITPQRVNRELKTALKAIS